MPKSKWNIATLKEFIERILAERQTALDAALVAQKAAVAAAFAASDKAITKSEDAQKDYNARSNEFRAALADQAKLFLPRTEADSKFDQLRDLIDAQQKQIVELQKFESRGEGGTNAQVNSKLTSQWVTGIIVSLGLAFLTAVGGLIFYMATHK